MHKNLIMWVKVAQKGKYVVKSGGYVDKNVDNSPLYVRQEITKKSRMYDATTKGR